MAADSYGFLKTQLQDPPFAAIFLGPPPLSRGPFGERIRQIPSTQDTMSCISQAALQTEGHKVKAFPHPPAVSLTTSPPFLISPTALTAHHQCLSVLSQPPPSINIRPGPTCLLAAEPGGSDSLIPRPPTTARRA